MHSECLVVFRRCIVSTRNTLHQSLFAQAKKCTTWAALPPRSGASRVKLKQSLFPSSNRVSGAWRSLSYCDKCCFSVPICHRPPRSPVNHGVRAISKKAPVLHSQNSRELPIFLSVLRVEETKRVMLFLCSGGYRETLLDLTCACVCCNRRNWAIAQTQTMDLFCNAGLRPKGYIDFAGLPPAPGLSLGRG